MRARHWATPVLAALGLADAAYLSVVHLQGELPACGTYSGCATVNSSPYALVYGVPIALLGAMLYLLILVAAAWRTRTASESWGWGTVLLYGLVLSGAIFMSYLTAIEFLVLHAVCYYCLTLAAITLALLILIVADLWAMDSGKSPIA